MSDSNDNSAHVTRYSSRSRKRPLDPDRDVSKLYRLQQSVTGAPTRYTPDLKTILDVVYRSGRGSLHVAEGQSSWRDAVVEVGPPEADREEAPAHRPSRRAGRRRWKVFGLFGI